MIYSMTNFLLHKYPQEGVNSSPLVLLQELIERKLSTNTGLFHTNPNIQQQYQKMTDSRNNKLSKDKTPQVLYYH